MYIHTHARENSRDAVIFAKRTQELDRSRDFHEHLNERLEFIQAIFSFCLQISQI